MLTSTNDLPSVLVFIAFGFLAALRIVQLFGCLSRETEDSTATFETDGLSAYACSKASGEFNFDFYGTSQSHSGLVSFYLGDVAGKGLPASLCQNNCISTLRLASSISQDPIGIVSEVNKTLCDCAPDGRFATLLYGTLDLSSGRLRLLSAGHPSPIRISRDEAVETLTCTPCLPVGVQSEHQYVLTEHRLNPGDTLVIYSDGIVESRDAGNGFLGEHRLAAIAKKYHSTLPGHLVAIIFDQIQAFCPNRKDDQTILAMHYSGLHSEFETNRLAQAV